MAPPETMKSEISQEKIAEFADFGPAPESFLSAPSYAVRVLNRQKAIKAEITEINERLRKAEAERDGAEAQLGQSALDYGLLPEMEEELKAKVEEAEKSFSTARGASSKEKEHYQKELHKIEEELKSAQRVIEPQLDRELKLKERLTNAETDLRHATAKIKRLQIELRNLEQGLVAGDPDEIQAKVQQLNAELSAAQDDEVDGGHMVNRLNAELTGAKTEMSPLRTKLKSLEAKKQSLLDEHEAQLGLHSEQAKRAQAWRRSRLAVAGRKLFDQEVRPKLIDGERLFGRIEQSREKVAKVQSELDLRIAALDAYDRDAFDKARYALYGAGGVVALTLLILLLYGC